MDKNKSGITATGKLYLIGYFLCLLAFIVPANSMSIGGQTYKQYLLTSYAGWVVLGIIVFFSGLQWLAISRNNKRLWWIALISGLYSFAYAAMIIVNANNQFETGMADSLVNKLHVKNNILPGLWLLAAGGALLLTTAILTIVPKKGPALPVRGTES